ncbi:MAG: glycosyltransferase family 9 protein [Candidatus Latescibacteria bacterium]|nr:glycosyltransferase family 9 protein [Candidatus Latescibacterota bacterium]
MGALEISKSSSIGVKRSGALGDFVLTLPAFAALRLAFPGAPLHLIGDPRFFSLARPDAALDHDSPGLIPLYSGTPLAPELRPFFADCTFFLAYAVDPEGQLGAALRRLVEGELLVWNPRPAGDLHITTHLLEPLRRHGLPIPDPIPRFSLLAAERIYAQACWQERRLAPPLVLIHPGSGGRRKCWPWDRFLALAQRCRQQGLAVLLLHGPAETDLAAQLEGDPQCCDLTLCPPGLLDLAGLLESAALFIGNDSGPGHLAAALGTPTLSLFGPTDPRIWSPLHPQARVIRAADGQLEAIAVEEVFEAAMEILRGGAPTGRP